VLRAARVRRGQPHGLLDAVETGELATGCEAEHHAPDKQVGGY
jgi:hypothetical protein